MLGIIVNTGFVLFGVLAGLFIWRLEPPMYPVSWKLVGLSFINFPIAIIALSWVSQRIAPKTVKLRRPSLKEYTFGISNPLNFIRALGLTFLTCGILGMVLGTIMGASTIVVPAYNASVGLGVNIGVSIAWRLLSRSKEQPN